MSRIGKKPIEVPAGVIVSVDPGRVTVSGPRGELRQEVPPRMQIAQDEGTITVTRRTERGEDRARVTAAAEGRVEVRAIATDRERRDRFVKEDRNVRHIARA